MKSLILTLPTFVSFLLIFSSFLFSTRGPVDSRLPAATPRRNCNRPIEPSGHKQRAKERRRDVTRKQPTPTDPSERAGPTQRKRATQRDRASKEESRRSTFDRGASTCATAWRGGFVRVCHDCTLGLTDWLARSMACAPCPANLPHRLSPSSLSTMSAPVVDAASSAAVSISSSSYVVHKFGGTSLAASECYANSAEIIRSIPREENHDPALVSEDVTVAQRTCVVVSAMGEVKGEGSLVGKLIRSRSPLKAFTRLDKVTNYLIQCTALAAQNDEAYLKLLAQLKQRHLDVVNELLGSDSDGADLLSSVLSALERDFSDLSHILRAVWLSRTYDPDHNWWFGFGEIWSARLMAAYLNLLDQRARAANPAAPRQDAIFVDARELIQLAPHKEPTPDYDASRKKIDAVREIGGL